MENWLTQQADATSNSWVSVIARYYPDQLVYWTNPAEHLKVFDLKWNTSESLKVIHWQEVIRQGARILDLGCGTGWLSAMLSRFENVCTVDALDCDDWDLGAMLPDVVRLMDGNMGKINCVRGFLFPLLRPDEYYDLIVASSSLHHSTNLISVMQELNRVLKREGRLLILNECVVPYWKMMVHYLTGSLRLLGDFLFRKSRPGTPQYASNAIFMDPILGDHIRSRFQWHQAITSAGFEYRMIDTKLSVYKDTKVDSLIHFICEKERVQRGMEVRTQNGFEGDRCKLGIL